jgi:serine phosphatase RsbU (regulator of sigma subunit)
MIFAKGFSQKGNYFLHNYLPSQYLASDQNRCILQDLHGRIFVANNDGLLINNGAEWDKMTLPFFCFTLGKDQNETIYAAGNGDFGRIIQNNKGSFEFESFKKYLPKDHSEIGKFWSVIAIKDHVYFCGNNEILDHDGKSVKVILPGEEGFHTFFKVDDHLILREKGKGLKILSYNNELVFLKGGEQFADNNDPVRGIIKGERSHYIVTPGGLYVFNFNKSLPELSTIEKVRSPIDNWLREKTVYCSANIGEDNFAFGSIKGGVVITDRKFNPLKYINSSNELQDDGVNYIYNDNQGHIWLALAKGVSLIEFNSPITKFTKADGIAGTIEGCTFHNDIPYLATDKGLLRYDPSSLKFEKTNILEPAWCVAQVNGSLLAGANSGLFILNKEEFELIYETPSAAHCIYHDQNNGLIYIGTETGFIKGTLEGRSFRVVKEETGIDADIRTIAADKSNIYFGTTQSGIWVENGNGTLTQLSKKNGVTDTVENYLFSYNGSVLIASDTNIYVLENNHGKVDHRFDQLNRKHAFSRAAGYKNSIWLTAKLASDPKASEFLVWLEDNGNKFTIRPSQLSRIKESDTKSFGFNGSLVYIGTNNGLYCYDTQLNSKHFGLNTFINCFKFGKDSVYNITPATRLDLIELPYANNSVEFKLGASDYIDKNELLFSYYLEGRDNSFGPFTNDKTKEYGQLHEGNYTFHVKSKNILGHEGQEIKIRFTILPPWYRTIWAYLIYALLLILVISLIIKLNVKRLREQNIRLENIITERTKEINKQKLEIEHKNQEITDSINYAKGIQDSILPSVNEIKKVWNDLFVFFQPKDIVSGDFYWFKQINKDEFLIACCDCTGHGVPGGFMSMICSDKLHDAARETTSPEKILFLANNSIKESLRQQNEGKSKDGMEICLLHVNTRTKTVQFSGANRTLLLIDSKNREVKEIKPTKASVASFTEFNFSYELNTLQLNEGDILIASTDGYPDQFGGPHGKKYMTKNFKNFISSIASLPVAEQEKHIRQNINDWMKGYEQVDDLLVIGIKL